MKEMTVKQFCKKLAAVYKMLGWEWCGDKVGEYKVPNAKMLFDAMKNLANTPLSLTNPGDCASTGGLTITRTDYTEEGKAMYALAFTFDIMLTEAELKAQLGV